MQTGPFSACGLISTDERLLHSTLDQNDYRPIDVTEDNLLEWFHELGADVPYEQNRSGSRRYGLAKPLMGKPLVHTERMYLLCMIMINRGLK